MASNHHAQPLPPSGPIHHQYHHQQQQQQQQQQRPVYSQQHPAHQPPSSRHLPPLASSSQTPPYPHRQDSSLPPLSPYNQRPPYPPSTSFPPPLSRQQSQHQAPPPPPSYHHQQPPSGHYPPPPGSSHGHSHWDSQQNGRHEPPPPPPPQHPHHPGHQRSDSSSSKLNGVPPTRRPSVSERESTGAPEPLPPSMAAGPSEEAGPPASDFVKKLAKMLDDPNYSQVVSWGLKGDCFVVKDMTEFTKSILPRMFKHSNFASFVRQLNKYDFHKIKNSDEFGDQCWTFHHPDFQRSNRDALENIKRKVPAQRKAGGRGGAATGPPLPGSPSDAATGGLANVDAGAVSTMQAQIDALSRSNEEILASLTTLERNYQNVLNEMVAYQRGMAAQDSLMQNLISHIMQLENGKTVNDALGKAIETYGGERPPFPHLNGMAGMSYSGSAASVDSNATLVNGSSPELTPLERSHFARQESLQRLEELKRAREARTAAASTITVTITDLPSSAAGGAVPLITTANPVAVATASATASNAAGQLTMLTRVGQTVLEVDARTGFATRVFSSGQSPAKTEEELAQAVAIASANPTVATTAAEANAANAAAVAVGGPTQPAPATSTTTETATAQPQPPPEWTYAGHQEATIQEVGTEPGPSTFAPAPAAGPSLAVAPMDNTELLESPGGSRLRIRKGFSPAWAVPPRVLLVDDDQVSRKLFSKFLQVSGCTIDVAVDGIGAVNKMNLEKYDLVLMDIVMPKLDGVQATSLIRQFDHATPIISMTSNSKPNDVVTYYSSGMNDILPKPFTRESLFTMLEKHLMHLKAITMSRPMHEDPGRMMTDDQYSSMLNLLGMGPEGFPPLDPTSGMILTDPTVSAKRTLDAMEEDRDTKRPRFEVVE